MPTYFMRTYGQSAGFGDPWTNDMDTATLDVTPELIRLCRRRSQQVLKLAAKDRSLWELHFWDPGRISWWECYPEELIESIGLIGAEEAADNGEPPLELVGSFFVLVAGVLITVGWTLAACTFMAGRSLARRQNYMFCLIMAGVMAAACTPFGTVLGVFTIIVLLRPSVKEVFGVPCSAGGPFDKPMNET